MIEKKTSRFKKCALALAVASCMSLATSASQAAGLGKLAVFSSLGQPLRAEVELSATAEELVGMSARLAPQDVFRQAGVDYSPGLADLRFKLERRNGKPVLGLTTLRPVNEPFLDFLVELTWPAGRLVREYTFLLDPPEFGTGPGMRSSVDAKVVDTVRGGGVLPEPAKQQDKAGETTAAIARAAAKATQAESGTRLVERGDTLLRIAKERRHASVTLEQMLVGLYRNNREAFIDNDINRLKSGVILNVPDEGAVAAIPEREARNVYVSAGDFSAYRRKLASATAASTGDAPSVQTAVGRISPMVEEKTPAVDSSRDQVKVSRTDAPVGAEIDRIAADKALQESQARVALLERNLSELQKLLEMKNQRLAQLENPAQSSTAPAPENKPPETVAVAPAQVEPPPVADGPAKESLPPSVPEKAPLAEVKPPAQTPPVAPPPVDAPVEEASLDGVLPLAGGAAAIALLTGLLLYRRRRKPDALVVDTTAAPTPSSLGPNSVFRMTGGQTVDTGSTPPPTGEFSQAGPGTIDTDEVDPVAEADVYMAYGRDAQAEEILLEAMHKDPGRLAIHAKLLEIYANRRSVKQFETLAGELYAQTAGLGPEWEKVAAMGAEIDPGNPLYGGAVPSARRQAPSAAFDPDATLVASSAAVAAAAAAAAAAIAAPAVAAPGPDLDFPVQEDPAFAAEQPVGEPDMAFLSEPAVVELAQAAVDEVLVDTSVERDDMSLDFDLGTEQTVAFDAESEKRPEEPYVDTVVTGESPPDALDFDLSGVVGGDSSLGSIPLDEAADTALSDLPPFDLPPIAALDVETASPAVDGDVQTSADPDFSPEGTLVISNTGSFGDMLDTGDFALDDLPDVPSEVMPALQPEVEENDAPDALAPPPDLAAQEPFDEPLTMDRPDLVSTIVNPMALDADEMDFDVKLSDSVFLGQPVMPAEFDIGSINLDLSADAPAVDAVTADEPAAVLPDVLAETASAEEPVAEQLVAGHDSQWEEVNTKLDLAKAYEEMGDLEGARELLHEVLSEGSADLTEQAQFILARIGG